MKTRVASQPANRTRRSPAPAGHPVLASKITVPGAPEWAVPRPRVTKLIADGTRWCPLTVLTGPAGAGKTMAVALWAAAEPGTVAWVTVDEYDNRPGLFWSLSWQRCAGPAWPCREGCRLPRWSGRAAKDSCCGLRRCWRPRIRR